MTQLYYIKFDDGEGLYMKSDEFDDFAKAMTLLSIHYVATVVEEKMYCIHWFDYIDDEWATIWSTEDEINSYMNDILEAKVEYNIEEFN